MKKELFIQEYNQLEDGVKRVYGVAMNEISNITDPQNPLYKYSSELNMFRQTRNILTHHVKNKASKYITVNDIMGKKMKEVEMWIFGKVADIARKGKAMYSCKMSDKVLDAVRVMNDNDYTHVPVLDENGRLIGVFGENTLVRILATDKAPKIGAGTRFKNIVDFIAKLGDENVMFDFVKGSEFVYKCDMMLGCAREGHTRLDILFLTEDGTCASPVEGLVTIWDFVG